MATLTAQKLNSGSKTLVAEILTATDDFTFKAGARQYLQFVNNTGGPVAISIVGDEASSSITVPGLSIKIDASTGYSIAIADAETVMLTTESISLYLADSENKPEISSDAVGVEVFLIEG